MSAMRAPGFRHDSVCSWLRVGLTRAISCLVATLALSPFATADHAASAPWSERIANSLLLPHRTTQPAEEVSATFDAETGFVLQGLEAEWYNTANGDYYRRAKEIVDAALQAPGGSGSADQPADAAAQLGRQLLFFYRVTLNESYYYAAEKLRRQLAASCGISAVEGQPARAGDQPAKHICTAEPFLAEVASVFDRPQDFAALTKDFLAWDLQNHQGRSGHAEKLSGAEAATSDAGLAAALVGSLEYYPRSDPGRAQLAAILSQIASTTESELNKRGNSSPHRTVSPAAACLYVYALLKGVRLGFLPNHFTAVAEEAWNAIVKDGVHVYASGTIGLSQASEDNSGHETTQRPAAGSSRASEQHGTGVFLMAATEVDLIPTASAASGQTVMVDSWYNSQQRKNAAEQMEYFHYKWSDRSDSGYSLLGWMFQSRGASLEALTAAPTRDRLRGAQFYIIVSPDIPVKNPNPHYMNEQDAAEIAAWVHDGGVLILMENDPPNADITHLNLLSDRFGIHFDDVLKHHIIGEQVEDGRIQVETGGPLFHQAHTFYMKDTCAISVRGAATALLRDRGDIVMAMAKYGRGTVFAAVDPWLYNEYTDGRRNPEVYGQFDNFAGGTEVVRWLLEQRPDANSGSRKNVEK
jgi:unsaturated rhamnogalacturonyl hydrolase